MSAAEATPARSPALDPTGASVTPGAAPRRAQGTLGASWRLLGSEMRLILGRRRNRAGILVLAAVPVLLAIALRASDPASEGDGPDLISAATSNGVFVALTALTSAPCATCSPCPSAEPGCWR
jgi:ABC-2 type transport system permease protein